MNINKYHVKSRYKRDSIWAFKNRETVKIKWPLVVLEAVLRFCFWCCECCECSALISFCSSSINLSMELSCAHTFLSEVLNKFMELEHKEIRAFTAHSQHQIQNLNTASSTTTSHFIFTVSRFLKAHIKTPWP
jgi:hypothetical protein